MMKRISVLFLLFFLFACSAKPSDKEDPIKEDAYIAPMRDLFIFDLLDDSLKERIKAANQNRDYQNYQFEMLDKEIYGEVIVDIDGNTVDLKEYDRLLMDVVSVNCVHCRKQLSLINEMADKYDVTVLQYFNVGNKEEIRKFYEDTSTRLSSHLILVEQNDPLQDYIKEDLKLEQYPSLIFYDKGKVCFSVAGETDEEGFDRSYDLAYHHPILKEDLQDENGTPFAELFRSMDDVKASLSIENQKRIEALDYDGYTEELTYRLMGNTLDFERSSNSYSDIYYNEISDYSIYRNKELALIYVYLRDNSETEKVEFINDLIDQTDSVSFVVVLIEGMESSSAALRNMKISFHCPVVSILGRIPDDFFRIGMISYPSAVFVNKGVFTGAYSGILDLESFSQAVAMFLGDDSIAYLKNN